VHDLVRIRLFLSFGRAGGAGDGGVDGVRARDGVDGRGAAATSAPPQAMAIQVES